MCCGARVLAFQTHPELTLNLLKNMQCLSISCYTCSLSLTSVHTQDTGSHLHNSLLFMINAFTYLRGKVWDGRTAGLVVSSASHRFHCGQCSEPIWWRRGRCSSAWTQTPSGSEPSGRTERMAPEEHTKTCQDEDLKHTNDFPFLKFISGLPLKIKWKKFICRNIQYVFSS